jgi:electron transfer flavoprotein beta subunit
MAYQSLVLVKQVPDTRNITGEVMTADGTMNRSALPAIFNPEDLHALEMALQIKEQHGGEVTVLTMGPLQATSVLRDVLYRGADRVILLSDRKFAGADTQATSYTLAKAIEKATASTGAFDLIFCGRQAIDGDTAQVGPQVAEKLGLPPCLLTVVASANRPRPASARKRIQYKLAAAPNETPALLKKYPEFGDLATLDGFLAEHNLKIPVWTAADLQVDETQLGLAGSPTQVHKVNFVVLETTESKEISPTPEGIKALIQELIQEYIVG